MSNTDVQTATADAPAAPEPQARSGGDQLARAGLLLLRGRTLVVLVLLIVLFGDASPRTT